MAVVSVFALQYCHTNKKIASAMPVKHSMTYITDVKPLLQTNCTPCHFPPKGFKKPLDTYSAASAAIDDMIARIKLNPTDRGFMPFKHPKLSESVIHVFEQWKADGLLEK